MSAAGSGVGGDSGSGCSGPDCSVSSAPVTTMPPPPPERPSDLPSRDEAESIARAVLAETGVAIDGASVDAFDNTLSWSFTFDPVVDGLPTYGFNSSVSIGAGGEVIDGYGVIGTPTAGDEYPLIGTPAAVERLNRGEAFGPSVAATATLRRPSPMPRPPRPQPRSLTAPTRPPAPTSSPARRIAATARSATFPCSARPKGRARRPPSTEIPPVTRSSRSLRPDRDRLYPHRRRGGAGLPPGRRRQRRLARARLPVHQGRGWVRDRDRRSRRVPRRHRRRWPPDRDGHGRHRLGGAGLGTMPADRDTGVDDTGI